MKKHRYVFFKDETQGRKRGLIHVLTFQKEKKKGTCVQTTATPPWGEGGDRKKC